MTVVADLKPDHAGYDLMQARRSKQREILLPPAHPQKHAGWAVYKRAQDVILSVIVIIFMALPLLLIALAIRYDSRGPVLFRQNRRGLHGELFPCLKFRTMYQHFSDPEAKVQSIRNDPRTTRVGSFLRSSSLDELPQIFNVLMGHMSLIGPRPHAPGTSVDGQLLPDIADYYLLRYCIKPGITGWAQVHGWRGILDSEEKLIRRLEHDFYYITHWSPLLDIKILLKTLTCLFSKHAF